MCGKLCNDPRKSAIFKLFPEKVKVALIIQKQRVLLAFFDIFTTFSGGAEEARTLDPHVANVVLYQLSYRPMKKEHSIYLIGNTV